MVDNVVVKRPVQPLGPFQQRTVNTIAGFRQNVPMVLLDPRKVARIGGSTKMRYGLGFDHSAHLEGITNEAEVDRQNLQSTFR